ncbi:MAG: class II SORL domain-containing protein [Thermodesulfobacteriota bacterium]
MTGIGELYHHDDWKKEKHVPVIEAPAVVGPDVPFEVSVQVGKDIAHPNTTGHHIRWIQVFFLPEGGKFAYQVGEFAFTAHGESTEGADTGPVHTDHRVRFALTLKASGTLFATSYCNIHGLWESSTAIAIR